MLFRHSPRSLLAWAGAAVAALVAVHGAVTDLAALHRRARSAGDEIAVVVAAHDLPLGSTVGAGDLSLSPQFERRLPPGSVRSRDLVVGRVVATPVLEGSVVTERHLAPRERTGLDGAVPPGMRAVRLLAEDGLRPEPGSLVDVLVTFDPAAVPPGEEATVTAVSGALVLGADDAEAGAVDGAGRLGVTLLVDPEAAKRLAFATANGIVTLALAPPEEARA